jgi:DNA-directed RNA polymerase subunit RPC12/RpoP
MAKAETEKTYNMVFTCINCGTASPEEIPRGTRAEGLLLDCPYCGCTAKPAKVEKYKSPTLLDW